MTLKAVVESMLNPTGYLHIDPNIPIESHGNILEWTGQILMLTNNDDLEQTIINGLLRNETANGFIPRTCWNGEKEPIESKPNRWKRFFNKWYRVDVSHSQFTFLAIGLFYSRNNGAGDLLLERMLRRLNNHKFSITDFENKKVDEGSFYPFGNMGLRMLICKELMKGIDFISKIRLTAIEKILLKINLFIMTNLYIKIKSSDVKNTWILLKALSEINRKYRWDYLKWLKKYKRDIIFVESSMNDNERFISKQMAIENDLL